MPCSEANLINCTQRNFFCNSLELYCYKKTFPPLGNPDCAALCFKIKFGQMKLL